MRWRRMKRRRGEDGEVEGGKGGGKKRQKER